MFESKWFLSKDKLNQTRCRNMTHVWAVAVDDHLDHRFNVVENDQMKYDRWIMVRWVEHNQWIPVDLNVIGWS